MNFNDLIILAIAFVLLWGAWIITKWLIKLILFLGFVGLIGWFYFQ